LPAILRSAKANPVASALPPKNIKPSGGSRRVEDVAVFSSRTGQDITAGADKQAIVQTRKRGGKLLDPLLVLEKLKVLADKELASIYGNPEARGMALSLKDLLWMPFTARDLAFVRETALAEIGSMESLHARPFEEQVQRVADAVDAALRLWVAQAPHRLRRYPVICDVAAFVNVALFRELGLSATATTVPDLHWWTEVTNPRTGEVWVVDPTVQQFSKTVLGAPVSRYARTVSELTGELKAGVPEASELLAKVSALREDMNEGIATVPDYVAHPELRRMVNRLLALIDGRLSSHPSADLELLKDTLIADERLIVELLEAKAAASSKPPPAP
jgi:hypothetical protein